MKEMSKAIPDWRANMIALGIGGRLLGLTVEQSVGADREALRRQGAAPSSSQAAPDRGRQRRPPSSISACGSPRPTSQHRQALADLGQRGDRARRACAAACASPPPIRSRRRPRSSNGLRRTSPRVGGVLLQAEDELASINMIIGASYGGTPSLTATSGPGLSLMIEAIGLATAAEIPIVVIDVMRGGPSTGIPTKSEQGDLNIAVYGLHGDAPHLVLAPQSVGDCLFTTQWATYLAEALQAPAIVLSDQFMGQTRAAIERPADVAFIGAAREGDRIRRRLQALRARRPTASRRWRFRERAAASTRRTA